ncbi:Glycerol-3-phosphate cytidylyltransferase [Staphylococcus aureus]|nr:Glycerol-3-phosphate cytidylyltransferase [Staphylococcus aureus]
MKRVITYGTYDLLHYGHIELLRRAREMGDYLIVALSTDEFNQIKHKKSYYDYEQRKMMLESIRYVDLVIPEKGWGQKEDDVEKFDVDVFVMGHDWEGEFDFLKDKCEVIYLNVQKAFRRLKSNKNYMVKMLNKLYRTIDTKR